MIKVQNLFCDALNRVVSYFQRISTLAWLTQAAIPTFDRSLAVEFNPQVFSACSAISETQFDRTILLVERVVN